MAATTVNIPREKTMKRIAETLELLWEGQAETNDGLVSYKKKQTVTDSQKKIARDNIAACATSNLIVQFTAGGWSGSKPYSQTVAVSGIASSDYPIADIDLSSVTTSNYEIVMEALGCVNRIATDDGTVTAYCYDEKPAAALTVILKTIK